MTARTLYILCGGNSRRMGQDKALLEINGKSLLEHWLQRAKSIFNEVVLLSGSAHYHTSTRQLQDEMQDTGPLSGLLTAMKDEKDEGDYLAVIAIDMPNLKDSTLDLLATAVPDKSQLLIASCGNELQPLAGIYHRKLADELTAYLESGRRSVSGFIYEIEPEYFNVAKEELLNINKPDVWQKFIAQHDANSTGPAS